MGYEFSELEKAVRLIAETFGLIAETFKEAWEITKSEIIELYEMLQEVEYEEKVKFKPILEIKPNKINYPNKRLKMHYCRSNC